MKCKNELIKLHKILVKLGEYRLAKTILFFMVDELEFQCIFHGSYKEIYDYIKDDVRYYKFVSKL